MNWKYLGSAALALFLMAGCNNQGNESSKDQEEADTEQQESQEGSQDMGGNPMQQGQQQSADVGDEELKKFSDAAAGMQEMNAEIQGEMIEAIENEGMDVDRFTEIQRSQQSPDQQMDIDEKELELYQKAQAELERIQKEAQAKMVKRIEEEGLTEERYKEISMALQSDQELMKKFQSMQGGQAQGGMQQRGQQQQR